MKKIQLHLLTIITCFFFTNCPAMESPPEENPVMQPSPDGYDKYFSFSDDGKKLTREEAKQLDDLIGKRVRIILTNEETSKKKFFGPIEIIEQKDCTLAIFHEKKNQCNETTTLCLHESGNTSCFSSMIIDNKLMRCKPSNKERLLEAIEKYYEKKFFEKINITKRETKKLWQETPKEKRHWRQIAKFF